MKILEVFWLKLILAIVAMISFGAFLADESLANYFIDIWAIQIFSLFIKD